MIIGIGHRARVGKDTVALILSDHVLSVHFHRAAFADALKNLCERAFDLPHGAFEEGIKDLVLARWGKSPRALIQEFGQLMKERWGDDFWCKKMETFLLKKRAFYGTNWVITDVRFPIEAEHVKKWGGILLHVTGERRGLMGDNEKAHISEHALDDYNGWDYTIHNDGSFDDLKDKAIRFLQWAKQLERR